MAKIGIFGSKKASKWSQKVPTKGVPLVAHLLGQKRPQNGPFFAKIPKKASFSVKMGQKCPKMAYFRPKLPHWAYFPTKTLLLPCFELYMWFLAILGLKCGSFRAPQKICKNGLPRISGQKRPQIPDERWSLKLVPQTSQKVQNPY